MRRFMKLILGNKGVTLIELIMAMLVMAIIMIAATSVFAPMLQAYQRANNFAEANTLLDNISAIIMSDVANATEITHPITLPPIITPPTPPPPLPPIPALTPLFRIKTSHYIDYYIDATGIIWRNIPGWSAGDDIPIELLPRHYYKFRGAETVFSVTATTGLTNEDEEGTVVLTLQIASIEGWTRDRTYTARPLGLN
jgi:prepilin-type N-terminal cleavage/methylation domain-containing protein